MKIQRINKKKPSETFNILKHRDNGQELFLDAIFKINTTNHKVEEIEIIVTKELNNIYKLVSAIVYCGKKFKNKTVFHFLINLHNVGLNPVHNTVKIAPKNLKIDSGQLILSSFNFYEDSSDEEVDCDYDIFDSGYNPETVGGVIIVGNP